VRRTQHQYSLLNRDDDDTLLQRDDDVDGGLFDGGGLSGDASLKSLLKKNCKRVCKIEKLRIVCTPRSSIGEGFDDEYFDDDMVRCE